MNMQDARQQILEIIKNLDDETDISQVMAYVLDNLKNPYQAEQTIVIFANANSNAYRKHLCKILLDDVRV